MMEAYSYSDPTRAADGLFLNPSKTLISNGISSKENAEADGFASGEGPPGFTDYHGACLRGNPPAGEHHSNKDRRPPKASSSDEQTQSVELQTGEDTGFDLEADFEAVFAQLDGEQQQNGENQSWDLEADLDAAFGEIFPAASQIEDPVADVTNKLEGEQAQDGEHLDYDVEADLYAAFDEFLPEITQIEDPVVDVNNKLEGEQQQDGKNQSCDLETDLNAAFDELLPEESQVEGLVVDDDDDGSLFAPDGDDADDLDSLFSPDDVDDDLLCSDSTKEGEQMAAKPVSNPEPSRPPWVASLPSLPKSTAKNGPEIPTQPAWYAAIFGQPPVTQSTGSTRPSGIVSSASIQSEPRVLLPLVTYCQHLPATYPLTPAGSCEGRPAASLLPSPLLYQTHSASNSSPFSSYQPGLLPVTPILMDQHQAAQNMRFPLTPTSSFQTIPARVEASKLYFVPSAPFKRSFTPDGTVEPPPVKKPKMITLPRASEVPAFFQMEKGVLRDFEKLAKAFVLDPKHPERYANGAENVQIYHKTSLPTLPTFATYPAQFLNEGSGEVFFGAKSDAYAVRTLKWPEDKDGIAELVLPLLRKVCKNEYQRRYALRNRDKTKKGKGQNAADPKENTNKQSMPPSDVAQSPSSVSSSPSPQSLEQSQHSTRTSTPESLPSQSITSPELSTTSTCNQGHVIHLALMEALARAQMTIVQPPSKSPSGSRSMAQINNAQSVDHDCATIGIKPGTQPFVFTSIPFHLPDLRFSITYVLKNSREVIVRSNVDLDVAVHPSHRSMLHFIRKTIPYDYYLDSLSVQGPSILRRIQHEDVWNAAVMEISGIPEMGSQVKCVAGLAKKTTAATTSQEVIAID